LEELEKGLSESDFIVVIVGNRTVYVMRSWWRRITLIDMKTFENVHKQCGKCVIDVFLRSREFDFIL